MRRRRQLVMIAAVAPALFGLSPGPVAAGHASAPSQRDLAARAGDRAASVRIVRGDGRRTGISGTVEIVSFADSREATVRVVRGGAGRSAAALARDRALSAPAARHAGGDTVVAFADPREPPVTVLRGSVVDLPDTGLFASAGRLELDRVAFAVDGAESSHGTDPGMWRPELDGPQGPMQVSAAAAIDIGGGDRFDLGENRTLGRAYLARLYRRYGNWPDAIAAYNWGPGNLDAWIAGGRLADGLPLEVEHYRDRVLRDTGLATATAAGRGQ
jgi:Transglycosylase SLT domain